MSAKTITTALLEVQKNAPALHKDAKNSHFKNRYVTLDAVLDTVRPLLNEHGVFVSQLPSYNSDTGQPTLKTVLHHPESNTTIDSEMLLFAPKQDPQGQGSAITYARRYALLSILGLTADEDDDGQKATESKTAEKNLVEEVKALEGTVELATKAQLTALKKARTHLGATRFDTYLRSHGVDKAEDLPTESAEAVLTWAREQAAKKAA